MFVSVVMGVAVVFGGGPLGLYWLGLGNVIGRPAPPHIPASLAEDYELLQRRLERQSPIRVHYLTPWHFLVMPFGEYSEIIDLDGGARAAWLIARNYAGGHLKRGGGLWPPLSAMALTIWITQNWTTDQVVHAAAAAPRISAR
jgi:hypothetical protein